MKQFLLFNSYSSWQTSFQSTINLGYFENKFFWGKIYYGFILQRFEVLNLFFICCMAFFTYSYDNQLQKRLSSERNILNDFSSFYKEYQKLVQKSFINLQEQ
eukprot:TRINITY_DN2127_c0_g1_i1.p6 TRINITY_DN2127_c0_g1~~TRINITY_DN2127_c0_g1_i1.p6  ORF type:complete len:102 (-),score=1.31 TRINITY_DN2127_c0_g1_i1:506-811(-)